MNPSDWLKIKYFTPNENWGEISLISPNLITELDRFRDAIQTPIFISCGTGGAHIKDSYHYQGLAVDILFPEKTLRDIPNLILTALKFNFTGVGGYPDWQYLGKPIGGMHLDVRPTDIKHTWIGIRSHSAPYIPLSISSLITLFR